MFPYYYNIKSPCHPVFIVYLCALKNSSTAVGTVKAYCFNPARSKAERIK